MSSQHVYLHRSVHAMIALAFSCLLFLPTASFAEPVFLKLDVPLSTADAGGALRLVVKTHAALLVGVTALEPDGDLPTELDPLFDEDVDPWDDDLDGRRPPLPPPPAVTLEAIADSAFQFVLRDRHGLAIAVTRRKGMGTPLRLLRTLTEGRYFLEVESLSGDDAVYALTLQRPSWP